MLVLLSYAVGACTLLALVACVALGLLKICDFIEERPSIARNLARTLTWTIIVLCTIITITDHLSYFFLLTSWVANFFALYIFRPKLWPFSSTSPLLLVISTLSPILAHLSLVHHFQDTTPEQLQSVERTPWPGGRQDWDTLKPLIAQKQSYGNGEALTCFVLCWLPALLIALGAITQNWNLPLAKGQTRRRISEFK